MIIRSPDEWANDQAAHWQSLSTWTQRLIIFCCAELTALAFLIAFIALAQAQGAWSGGSGAWAGNGMVCSWADGTGSCASDELRGARSARGQPIPRQDAFSWSYRRDPDGSWGHD